MSRTGWNYTAHYIQFYSHEWKTGKVWQGGARQVAPSCPVWKVNTAGEGLALLHQLPFCQYYQLVYKSQATIPGEQFLRTTFNWYESSNNVLEIIFWSLCDMFLIICCRREEHIPFFRGWSCFDRFWSPDSGASVLVVGVIWVFAALHPKLQSEPAAPLDFMLKADRLQIAASYYPGECDGQNTGGGVLNC